MLTVYVKNSITLLNTHKWILKVRHVIAFKVRQRTLNTLVYERNALESRRMSITPLRLTIQPNLYVDIAFGQMENGGPNSADESRAFPNWRRKYIWRRAELIILKRLYNYLNASAGVPRGVVEIIPTITRKVSRSLSDLTLFRILKPILISAEHTYKCRLYKGCIISPESFSGSPFLIAVDRSFRSLFDVHGALR